MSNIAQILVNTSAIIHDGYVVQFSNNLAIAATPTSNNLFSGIATQASTGSQSILVQTSGLLSPQIAYLGDGYACSVGANSIGQPVRVTDPTCVSSPNYIGYCDADGYIYVQPRRDNVFRISDFGAKFDGVTDDTASWKAALNACNIGNGGNGGGTLLVDIGITCISQELSITKEGTVIHGTANGAPGSTILLATAPMRSVINIVNNECKLEGLVINGNNLSQFGVYRQSDTFGHHQRVEILNCTHSGWYASRLRDGYSIAQTSGPSNPAITPSVPFSFEGISTLTIKIISGGTLASGLVTYAISLDGGSTYGTTWTLPTNGKIRAQDPDSLETGVNFTFASGTYTTNNTYVFTFSNVNGTINDATIFEMCSGYNNGYATCSAGAVAHFELTGATIKSGSGTVAITNGSNTIVGTGTAFLTGTLARFGDFIWIDGYTAYQIIAVVDDTHIIVGPHSLPTSNAAGLDYGVCAGSGYHEEDGNNNNICIIRGGNWQFNAASGLIFNGDYGPHVVKPQTGGNGISGITVGTDTGGINPISPVIDNPYGEGIQYCVLLQQGTDIRVHSPNFDASDAGAVSNILSTPGLNPLGALITNSAGMSIGAIATAPQLQNATLDVFGSQALHTRQLLVTAPFLNNFNVGGSTAIELIDAAYPFSLTGLVAGFTVAGSTTPNCEGQRIEIYNYNEYPCTIMDGYSGSSSVNQIWTGRYESASHNIIIPPYGSVKFRYGQSQKKWFLLDPEEWDTPNRHSITGILASREIVVFSNTTNGAITLTMCANPFDGQVVTIKDEYQKWNTHNLTVAANVGQTIQDPGNLGGNYGASITLSTIGGCFSWVYDAVQATWLISSISSIIGPIISNITSTTINYQVVVTDSVISVGTLITPITITLESAPVTGRTVIIKDANGSAATYNITVSGNGHNIDANPSAIITQNFGSVELAFNGSVWMSI